MTPKYNITLAFVGNYCDFEHLQISGSTVSNYTISAELSMQQINSFAGYTYWPDIGSLAAVQEVNSSPNILPDFNIVVKRFSDCGLYWPTVLDDYSGASGGFATSVMFSDIADRNTDVLAVVGNEYSTTCRGPAEALSIQKIPYCSSSSGSPRLSDKNKYPYFWRTITARGIGEHMYQVLRIWNVKRIAVVYQEDDELGLYNQLITYTAALDIIESMQNHNILIVTQFGLRTNYNAKDIEYLTLMLKFVDARYIILSAQTEFSSSLLKKMQEHGMIGPQYVWFGFIPVFGSAAAKAGFILFQQSLPDMSSNNYHRFYETVSNIAEIEAAEFGSFNLQTYVAPQYDCAMMLLLGFDKLLKSYPAFTPAMLANRELQHFMNYTWFQNLNYNGLGASPMLLNQYGDFESSYDIFYYTGDNDNLTSKTLN
ncbi:hypothetical protein HDU79_000492 [Rhizoclosmatium sp. JEL0117]|nr:hypothetical protein HDU79_000492 [Rhizoclosmatium sp. JEL0117]